MNDQDQQSLSTDSLVIDANPAPMTLQVETVQETPDANLAPEPIDLDGSTDVPREARHLMADAHEQLTRSVMRRDDAINAFLREQKADPNRQTLLSWEEKLEDGTVETVAVLVPNEFTREALGWGRNLARTFYPSVSICWGVKVQKAAEPPRLLVMPPGYSA